MKNLRFTVIVPTRERLDTLKWTIKTLTEEKYENLEIIISDNWSQDGTGDYVKTLQDPRVKYVNTGRRVSMAENYEFGLSSATGDYVTFIGDDDGLVSGALEKCNELLTKNPVGALGWRKGSYIWNGFHVPYLTNTLDMPETHEVYEANTMEEMTAIMTFKKFTHVQIPVYFLPCIYNGFISRTIMEKAKAQQGGRFFHSRYPDIYSSLLLPHFIERYIFSNIPYTINGVSSRGNGTGSILLTTKKKMEEAEKFEQESTIPIHHRIRFTDFASIPFIMMESYFQVCDHLKIEPVLFNMQSLADEAMRYAKAFTPQTIPWTISSIEETAKVNGVTVQIDKETAMPGTFAKMKKGIKEGIISVIRKNKGLYVRYLRAFRKKDIEILHEPYPSNILGACQLAGKKLGYTTGK